MTPDNLPAAVEGRALLANVIRLEQSNRWSEAIDADGLWERWLRNNAEALLSAQEQLQRAVEALTRIEKWFGEFPETGKFWDDDPERPMSYGAAYGSNGERDFMRKIARDFLATLPRSPTDAG